MSKPIQIRFETEGTTVRIAQIPADVISHWSQVWERRFREDAAEVEGEVARRCRKIRGLLDALEAKPLAGIDSETI